MNHFLLYAAFCFLLLSSCRVHQNLTTNANLNTTQVVLSDDNFKVVQKVHGRSEATYILGIGGLSKEAMIAEARNRMLESANLIGSSRAVVNESIEIRHSFFPFVRTYKVYVTAHIIEFY